MRAVKVELELAGDVLAQFFDWKLSSVNRKHIIENWYLFWHIEKCSTYENDWTVPKVPVQGDIDTNVLRLSADEKLVPAITKKDASSKHYWQL